MDAKSPHGQITSTATLPKLLPGRQQTLTITRFLPAPPALVFALWTEPALLLHWYAPREFAVALCEGDAAVGSDWRIVLRHDAGLEYRVQRQFVLVDAPRRLHYTEQCVGSSGAFYAAMTQVCFEKLASKTKLTLRAEPQQHYCEEDIAEWLRGGNDLMDRLNTALRQR